MFVLRIVSAVFFLVGPYLGQVEAQVPLFQISDATSRDYKIASLAIRYSDGKITEGFRVLDQNQLRIVRWADINSLEITGSTDGARTVKYLQCVVELSDSTRQTLYCLEGVVTGKTRNGDYKAALSLVKSLLPPK